MPKTRFDRIKQRILRKGIRVGLCGLMLLCRILPLHTGVAVGGLLGWMAFYVLGKERHRALKHIQLALGDIYPLGERRRIIKSSFQNLGKSLFEILYLSRLSRDGLNQLVRIEGEDCLKKAIAQGHGVIFVTGHLGNWELGPAAVAMRVQLAGVAAPIYDSWIEKLIIRIREVHGVETIVRSHSHAIRRLLSILRAGGAIGILIDQDIRTDGVFVPFFGRPAYTPTGPAALALRTGAAVVIGFIIRLPDNSHRLMVKGPLKLIQTGNREADIQENTANFSRYIEQFIRNYPEQWVWMHKRWKTVKGN